MIRNEIDIINAFIDINSSIFDKIIFADMMSSDGTREIIDIYRDNRYVLDVLEFPYQAKYQSEITTSLAKKAFFDGADWVFPLDADEFMHIESRDILQDYLTKWAGSYIHMPWMNLVPTRYGSLNQFEFYQEYKWSGRLSKYNKVAISKEYSLINPEFIIDSGSHNVLSRVDNGIEDIIIGMPIRHIPVRSPERAAYKAKNALILQKNKHSQQTGEGIHHAAIANFMSGKLVDDRILNGICYDYGNIESIKSIDPAALDWPSVSFRQPQRTPPCTSIGLLAATGPESKDGIIKWVPVNQPRMAPVYAEIERTQINLRPQPQRGSGRHGPQFFPALMSDLDVLAPIDLPLITKAVSATQVPPPVEVFSAWTDLVPILGALMTITRPRRFVELGTHNGMSYFSACHYSNILKLQTECIAIDSWEGDQHAGFHDPAVLSTFKTNANNISPDQIYIHTYFNEAAHIFDSGSIDLLHIDGFHVYDAVMNDFNMWKEKLSDRGVIIFHEITMYERGFGVWKLWAELKEIYPSFEVGYGHGLGILYLGVHRGATWHVFDWLARNRSAADVFKMALEDQVGVSRTTKKELTRLVAELRNSQESVARLSAELQSVIADKWWRRTKLFRNLSNAVRKLRKRPTKSWPG